MVSAWWRNEAEKVDGCGDEGRRDGRCQRRRAEGREGAWSAVATPGGQKKTAAPAEFQEPLQFRTHWCSSHCLITEERSKRTVDADARTLKRYLPKRCRNAGVIFLGEQLDFFSPQLSTPPTPYLPSRGAAQRLFMIPRDNLRVSGRGRSGGPHFRPSAAVSPDRSLRYQITRLLKLYGAHRNFFFLLFFSPLPFCPTQPVWTYLRWSWGFLVLIKSQNFRGRIISIGGEGVKKIPLF